MKIERFEDSLAWQKAKELCIEIYLLFDKSHDFGFKDQIERATALIMNNITEGYERKSNVELRYRNNTYNVIELYKKTLIPLYKLYKPYKLSSYGKSNYFFSTEWSG